MCDKFFKFKFNNNNKNKNNNNTETKGFQNVISDNNNNLIEIKLPFDKSIYQFNKFINFEYNKISSIHALYVNKNTIMVSHSKYFNISKLLPFFGYNNNYIKEIIDLNEMLHVEQFKQLLYIIYEDSISHSININSIFMQLANHVDEKKMGETCFSALVDFGGIIRRPDFSFISSKTFKKILPKEYDQPFRAPLIPEFVAELRPLNENFHDCFYKMVEYIQNGVQSCLLIDRIDSVFIHFCASPRKVGDIPLIPKSVPILGQNFQPIGVNQFTICWHKFPMNDGYFPQVTIPLVGVLNKYPLNFGNIVKK